MKFEVKIHYRGINERGVEAIIKRIFLLDAETFTEAEAIVTKEMETVNPDFFIETITRSKIEEVITNEEDYEYYKAKVVFTGVDEVSGRESKTTAYYLVEANSTQEANETTQGLIDRNSIVPFSIEGVQLTKITDVLTA